MLNLSYFWHIFRKCTFKQWKLCVIGLLIFNAFISTTYFARSMLICTDSTKINRPGHNICMYWTNFWQSTAHVKQNIFEKTSYSPNLYASFATFCAKIGQIFEALWVFELCLKIDKSLLSKENVVDFGILPIV